MVKLIVGAEFPEAIDAAKICCLSAVLANAYVSDISTITYNFGVGKLGKVIVYTVLAAIFEGINN